VLVQLYWQSSIDQVARAEATVSRACDEITNRYRFYMSGLDRLSVNPQDRDLRAGLGAVVTIALANMSGMEGGIWQRGSGSLAYAYPTYEGTGPKTDLPAAELQSIRAVNADALTEDRAVSVRETGRQQTLLLQACPLPVPLEGATAWAMVRVFTGQGAGYTRLLGGLGVLLVSVLASSAWTTHLLLTWSRKLGALETGIARRDGFDPPILDLTGERELDRIVTRLNAATVEIRAMRGEAERLSAQVAASERLAALGRVAAGIAHEIRNPIAAMRLKAENALRGDDARRRGALEMVLGQIARLDHLLRDLLTLTHRSEPQWRDTDVHALLAVTVELHRELAEDRGIRIDVASPAITWALDPDKMRRALGNLVLNAIQNVPAGGAVTASADQSDGNLHLLVADNGPGLPEQVRRHLFEPFVTERAEGTGLGLSIVKEIAEQHGGTVTYRDGRPGSTFNIVVPRREG